MLRIAVHISSVESDLSDIVKDIIVMQPGPIMTVSFTWLICSWKTCVLGCLVKVVSSIMLSVED